MDRYKRSFCIALLVSIPLAAAMADVDLIDFSISVSDDANLTADGSPEDGVYWVETDGTEGLIVLRFQDDRIAELPPCELPFIVSYQMRLTLTIPDVPDAGSGDGLIVFYGESEIGRADRAAAGTQVVIPLDACKVPPSNDIVFILRGAGTDGLAVAAKASGYGAVLRVLAEPDDSSFGGDAMMGDSMTEEDLAG